MSYCLFPSLKRRSLILLFSAIAILPFLAFVSYSPVARADRPRAVTAGGSPVPCTQENFLQAPVYSATGLPTTIVSEDFDGDGKIDIAAGSVAVSIYRNTGATGTLAFESAVRLPSGSTPGGIVAADFDNDGKKDIAISIRFDSVINLYLNTSAGPVPSVSPQKCRCP